MRRLLASATILAATLVPATSADAATRTVHRTPLAVGWLAPTRLTPCVNEDGSGGRLPCYWDAKTRGNGTGRSYWIDRAGNVHYLITRR